MSANYIENGNRDGFPFKGSHCQTQRRNSIEDSFGVILIPTPGLMTVVLSGEALLNNWPYIYDKGVQSVVRNFGRSEAAAIDLIEEGMNIDGLSEGLTTRDILRSQRAREEIVSDAAKARKIPSAVLVRRENLMPGNYCAFSAAREFFVELSPANFETGTPAVIKPTIYHIVRSVDENERAYRTREDEREGKLRLRIGRHMTNIEILIHRGARSFVQRSASGIAVYANMQVENLVQESCHPYAELYEEGSEELAVVKGVAELLMAHGSEIDIYGVSREATLEPNRSIVIDQRHPHVPGIQEFITTKPPKGLGANPENGDVVYGYWETN